MSYFRSGQLLDRLFACSACFAAAVALCSLWWPYGWDHGCFAYVADTIMRGGEPYRDAWDFKGPLTFYVFVVTRFLFGPGMWGIRLFDLLVVAGGVRAAYLLVARFSGITAARWTVCLLVLAHYSFGNWYTAQPDDWVAWMLTAYVALLCVPSVRTRRHLAAAGFCVGLCTLFKPVYALALVLGAIAIVPPTRAAVRTAVGAAIALLAPFLAPIVLMIGALAAHGVLDAFVDVHLRFSLERIATDPFMQMSPLQVLLNGLGLLVATPTFMLALPFAGAGVGAVFQRDARAGWILGAWPALALIVIMLQRKFSYHNYTWHTLYPALGVCAAIGLAQLWQLGVQQNQRYVRMLVVVCAAVFIKLVTRAPAQQLARLAGLLRGRVTLAEYREQFDTNVPALLGGAAADFGFGVARDFRIAEYLRQKTSPDDRVLMWSDPLVNHLSNRVSITPVTLASAFTTNGLPARRERYRRQLVELLARPDSKYVGVPLRDLEPGDDDANLPKYFPELPMAIERYFSFDTTVGDVKLYRRKVSDSAPVL